MKTKVLSAIAMLLLGTTLVFAQAKIDKFEVNGNCGMCEKRIEKAAKSVNGVSKADWNLKTKVLKITFDPAKTSTNDVQMAISKVGHDTPLHRASDKVYNALPGCCKFDRAPVKKKVTGHEGHNH